MVEEGGGIGLRSLRSLLKKVTTAWRAIILAAALLIGSVALTIALDAIFTGSPGHQWATAVQASATLVLVAVTGVYVWITYRQMKLQSNPLIAIRLAAQEETARQAVVVFQQARRKADQLIGSMPIVDSPGEPMLRTLIANAQDLSDRLKELQGFAPGMPTAFGIRTWLILPDLITASGEVYLFSRACELEKLEASQAHREWSWEGARKWYLTEVRVAERNHPEWTDIVRLTALRGAVEHLVKLEADITAYLLAPAPG
jgi:hypothetical protein